MNLNGFTLKEGQRFQLSFGNNKQFIAEIVKLRSSTRAALKVIQLQHWYNCSVGFEYVDEDLSRDDYTYLPGQDKPAA